MPSGGRRRRARAALIAAGLLAIPIAALFLHFSQGTDDHDWPGLSEEACWFETNEIARARCGYVRVPESRGDPASRWIDLAVAVLLPDAPLLHRSTRPLLFLEGGPGAATGIDAEGILYWAELRRDVSWTRDRPLILIDYRGTGQSSPLPMCSEIAAADTDNFALKREYDAKNAAWRAAAAQCKARLRAHGADLTAYDTTADALDLVAVRQSLDLRQWDIWGVSYGTRVAFELMRHDSDAIRSAILDSALPPDAALFGDSAAALDSVITRMRDDCLADPACAERYGDIRQSVADATARLDEHPMTGKRRGAGAAEDLIVTGREFLRTLAVNFYDVQDLVHIPLMVEDVAVGDYDLLSEFVVSFAIGLGAAEGINNAILLSHFCRDEFPFEPLADIRHPPALPPFDGARPALRELTLCPDWAGTADPAVNTPVSTDLPVLFLSGAYDVATPTAWARAAMRRLPNSHLVEFPDGAHGLIPRDPCGVSIVAEFLERPDEKPDASCLEGRRPPVLRQY